MVADARTLEDKSLLFVDVGYDDSAEVKTVRLSAQHANAIPVAVAVATMGIEEVIALADADGVFRGGSRQVDGAGSKGHQHEHGGQGRGLAAARLGELLGTSSNVIT